MSESSSRELQAVVTAERLTELTDDDLASLCEATDAAIIDGGGFGWVTPPGRTAMERYFRGVLLVPGDHAYFVHSYALAGGDAAECIATTEYGGPVVAMVARGNRAGTQFHVEKSQEVGLRILANFLRWEPVA